MNYPIRHAARFAAVIGMLVALASEAQAAPAYVDITWMSISNMYYQLGALNILTDGYITRIPHSEFSGGGGGLASTREPYKPDVAAVTRVLTALGGASRVNLLLSGHSHFDHSFDTATWSKLTGAKIIGPKTTCLQTQAEGIAADRCRAVYGGEAIQLAEGITMRVVRLNHSGDPAINPEQHNAVELQAPPVPDRDSGGLHAGVAEDFPNGGGSRGFLFTVDGPDGRFSWFYQNSASAVDFRVPIVVDGVNYGAPLDNIKAAMKDAGLEGVDLWIGSTGEATARLLVPILKPKSYIPVHWDGLWGAFGAGVTKPFADQGMEAYLAAAGVTLWRPGQYMDKWRLSHSGVREMDNSGVKKALGFAN